MPVKTLMKDFLFQLEMRQASWPAQKAKLFHSEQDRCRVFSEASRLSNILTTRKVTRKRRFYD